jgi:hypothetical protein
MAAKRELTPEQIRDLRELAITDHDFLAFVRSASHLGYGRMMQIVEREWYRAAQERGDPVSGVLVVSGCLGFMSRKERQEFDQAYRSDPLFRDT